MQIKALDNALARGVANVFLPRIGVVFAAKGVEMRCDAQALQILQSNLPLAPVEYA